MPLVQVSERFPHLSPDDLVLMDVEPLEEGSQHEPTMPGYESQAEDHRQAAAREMESLRMVINEFKTIYGEEFIRHGDAEYAPEALERLVNFVL